MSLSHKVTPRDQLMTNRFSGAWPTEAYSSFAQARWPFLKLSIRMNSLSTWKFSSLRRNPKVIRFGPPGYGT